MFTTGIPYRAKDTKVAQLLEDTEVAELLKEADALYASRKKRANPSEFDL